MQFDLWLSYAPSTHSDKHSHQHQHSVTGAMAGVAVGDISLEAIDEFWRQKIRYHVEVTKRV